MSVALDSGPDPHWPDGVNPTDAFLATLNFVKSGRGNLFVTGRAGTGKSTLLRATVSTLESQLVIAAPTGIAALNVGSETIHSLFRLPHGLLIDCEELRSTPRDVFKLDGLTLVIDEVSMVRSDVINAIDVALRRQRKVAAPFGGVRVIAFGDTHQLPPIVSKRSREDDELHDALGGVFFFHAPAARSMKVVELTQVFRQKDERFIALLNERSWNFNNAAEQFNSTLLMRVTPSKLLLCDGCVAPRSLSGHSRREIIVLWQHRPET